MGKSEKDYFRTVCGWGRHSTSKTKLRACLHGGGGPQVGEVTPLGGVKQ